MSFIKKSADWFGTLAELAMLLFVLVIVGGVVAAVVVEWVIPLVR